MLVFAEGGKPEISRGNILATNTGTWVETEILVLTHLQHRGCGSNPRQTGGALAIAKSLLPTPIYWVLPLITSP